jgi:hypothetical protein
MTFITETASPANLITLKFSNLDSTFSRLSGNM